MKLFLSILCSISIYAYAQDDLLSPLDLDFDKVLYSKLGDDTVSSISMEQAMEDASFYAYFVKGAYSAYPDLLNTMDFEGYLNKLSAKIKKGQLNDTRSFAQWLVVPFLNFWEDSHFGVYWLEDKKVVGNFGANVWYSYRLEDDSVKLRSCDLPADSELRANQTFLSDDGRVKRRDVFKTKKSLASLFCLGQEVAVKKIESKGKLSPKIYSRAVSEDTAYVRIGTFKNNSEIKDKIIDTAKNSIGFSRVILDLRGNGGGNFFILDWLKELGARTPRSANERLEFTDSPASSMLLFSYFSNVLRDPNLSENRKKDLEERKSAAEQKFRDILRAPSIEALTFRKNKVVFERDSDEFRGLELDKDLIVLVDEGCASACEYATRLLQKSPRVSIYGVPTAGVGEGPGDAMPLTLPNTKLHVRIPVSIFFEEKNRKYSDPKGANPQYWIEGNSLELLQKLEIIPSF